MEDRVDSEEICCCCRYNILQKNEVPFQYKTHLTFTTNLGQVVKPPFYE